MNVISYKQLDTTTDAFFDRHWNQHVLGPAPAWQCWEPFLFGPVPNYQRAGFYAVFFGEDLRYIGLGASRGFGIYAEHGISRRLMQHVYMLDRDRGQGWQKLRAPFAAATSIYTIGLPDTEYLAAALETFLIRRLAPSMNKRV